MGANAEDGHCPFCLEAASCWCLEGGWAALVTAPGFSTGGCKVFGKGCCLKIILLLVCGKPGCVTLHECAPVEQYVR